MLSQSMVSSLCMFRDSILKSQLKKITSLVVCDRANNSDSVLDVVTVSCLLALY